MAMRSRFVCLTGDMNRSRRYNDSLRSRGRAVRQIVILAVGARFKSAYEIYAHSAVARARHEISDARLATLAAGQRPSDLSELEGAGYDVAVALLSGGALPEPTYQHALALFGQSGLNEIIYLVGHYCFVSTTLNGFAIGVPESGH
jgi:4-carboxymuconolactone decarboxylase